MHRRAVVLDRCSKHCRAVVLDRCSSIVQRSSSTAGALQPPLYRPNHLSAMSGVGVLQFRSSELRFSRLRDADEDVVQGGFGHFKMVHFAHI